MHRKEVFLYFKIKCLLHNNLLSIVFYFKLTTSTKKIPGIGHLQQNLSLVLDLKRYYSNH